MEQSSHRSWTTAGEPDPTAAAALGSPVRHLRVPCISVGLSQSYPSPQTLPWVTHLTHPPEAEPACGTEPASAPPGQLGQFDLPGCWGCTGVASAVCREWPCPGRGARGRVWVPGMSRRAQPGPSGALGLTGPLASQPGGPQCLRQDPGPGRGSFVPLSRGRHSRAGLLQPRLRVPRAVFSRRRSLEGSPGPAGPWDEGDARAAGGRPGQLGRWPARGLPRGRSAVARPGPARGAPPLRVCPFPAGPGRGAGAGTFGSSKIAAAPGGSRRGARGRRGSRLSVLPARSCPVASPPGAGVPGSDLCPRPGASAGSRSPPQCGAGLRGRCRCLSPAQTGARGGSWLTRRQRLCHGP